MAQLLLHLAIITIYENTFMTDSREFPFPWEFPGIPDLLFPFPGNPVTIVSSGLSAGGASLFGLVRPLLPECLVLIR